MSILSMLRRSASSRSNVNCCFSFCARAKSSRVTACVLSRSSCAIFSSRDSDGRMEVDSLPDVVVAVAVVDDDDDDDDDDVEEEEEDGVVL